MEISPALSPHRDGTVISIEVIPGAKRASFPDGYNQWRKSILCRVREPATDGQANLAVIEIIAGTIGCPTTSVSLLSGHRSHQKRILIKGTTLESILSRLCERMPEE